MAREYYYFVSGLPAITPDDSKLLMTPLMFLHSAREHLDKVDYDLLKLLVVDNDILNLVNLLYHKEIWFDENTISKEEWVELIELLKDISDTTNLRKKHLDDNILPLIIEYLHAFLRQEERQPEQVTLKDLFTLFYNWAATHEDSFVRDWFKFESEMKNIIIALNCRKHKLPVEEQLIGTNDLTTRLAKSTAADFGLGNEYTYLEVLNRLTEQSDIIEKEKGYDALRWKWLDNRIFFEYFTIPRIMAYYIRSEIVYRWIHLSQSVGEKRFGQVLHDLETSFEFPEEFALNKR